MFRLCQKTFELQSVNVTTPILFIDTAWWPATPTYPCTVLAQWRQFSQCFECWRSSILTNLYVLASETRMWKKITWTEFDQKSSSKRENLESSCSQKTALKSAIHCQSKTGLQSPAIESKHSHLNFGAPEFPELYPCYHYSSARCEMTSHHSFIWLYHIAFNPEINWSHHSCGETHNEYVISRCATYYRFGTKSESELVFMTHLSAIFASPSGWIITITTASAIVPFHSFPASVSLLCIPNSLSSINYNIVVKVILWTSPR